MRNFIMVLASVLCVSSGAAAGDTARIAVLSDVLPNSLILEVAGQAYRIQNNSWRQTSRGFETTAFFPRSLLRGQNQARLVREDGRGYSNWGRSEMQYLQRNDVTANDPACLGGTAWCATRGL